MTDSPVLRQALDALPPLVWVAALDGALEYLNRRCAECSGLSIDDLLGWDWGWVVHPADLPWALDVWAASVRDGTPHEVEFRLRAAVSRSRSAGRVGGPARAARPA